MVIEIGIEGGVEAIGKWDVFLIDLVDFHIGLSYLLVDVVGELLVVPKVSDLHCVYCFLLYNINEFAELNMWINIIILLFRVIEVVLRIDNFFHGGCKGNLI